jgi:hypothetical protein
MLAPFAVLRVVIARPRRGREPGRCARARARQQTCVCALPLTVRSAARARGACGLSVGCAARTLLAHAICSAPRRQRSDICRAILPQSAPMPGLARGAMRGAAAA